MAELCCKHCGSGSFVRNGMAAGHQRYRCKACGRNFTATPARGKPPAMKALAVLLYALGNVSQGVIAKLLGVSHVAVYKWVRAAGEGTPAPSATPSDDIVQIDEMWHFVDGKKGSIRVGCWDRSCGGQEPGFRGTWLGRPLQGSSPAEIVGQVAGGDTPEAAHPALQAAVVGVHVLDVEGAVADADAGREVDRLVVQPVSGGEGGVG